MSSGNIAAFRRPDRSQLWRHARIQKEQSSGGTPRKLKQSLGKQKQQKIWYVMCHGN